MRIVQELKTRNVIKVGIAYAVLAWILVQLTYAITDYLALPDWTPKLALVILITGFVPAVILAWVFELTPDGVKLEQDVERPAVTRPKKSRKLDYTIIGALAMALGVFIWKSGYEEKLAEVASMEADLANPPAETPVPDVPDSVLFADIDNNSIAVLPFENRSSDAADVYFTDGIHDDLLTQLSKIDALQVISRTSVLEYRHGQRDLKKIAIQLGVANIMEGSVQKAGDRVRINVQLIDARSSDHLWAEIYDRELTTNNLFDIQSEIARAIASALQATLSEAELADVGNVPTDNVEAYDLYLQARRFSLGETRVGYQEATELYQQALNLDPGFKQGWIGLARAHITNYWSYGGNPADVQSARAAIDKAREIDANFPELHVAEGFYWYWGHLDYERALYHLQKAISQMPGNAEAHMWHGWVSRRSGLWEQSVLSMSQSLRLDPRVSFNWAELGGTYLFLHRYDEARSALIQSLQVNPDDYWGKTNMADLELMVSGDVDAALRLTDGAQDSEEYGFFEQYMDTHIYAGRYQEALDTGRQLDDALEIQRGLIMFREIWAAQVLFYMGREEEARNTANAALFRLKSLDTQLGDDYRIDLAKAMISPMLGESPDAVQRSVAKSMASRPDDKILEIQFNLRYARIYAMAGQTTEAVAMLEALFSPPSETTTQTVELDPAFDKIRNDADFIAMMDRYR